VSDRNIICDTYSVGGLLGDSQLPGSAMGWDCEWNCVWRCSEVWVVGGERMEEAETICDDDMALRLCNALSFANCKTHT